MKKRLDFQHKTKNNAWNHFRTITHHRLLVMKGCFQVGLYRQGLLHDLSKYTWTEFRTGVRYYQGDRSPNAAEKEIMGYSPAGSTTKGGISTILSTGPMFPPGRITGGSLE